MAATAAARLALPHRHAPRPALPVAAEVILSKEPELKADFSRAQQAMSKARQKGVPRYLPNPGGRARGGTRGLSGGGLGVSVCG